MVLDYIREGVKNKELKKGNSQIAYDIFEKVVKGATNTLGVREGKRTNDRLSEDTKILIEKREEIRREGKRTIKGKFEWCMRYKN